MAVVTKVTQQKRPGRYNIYLDDEFALAVDEKILIEFNLFKGTELDDTQLEKVKVAEYAQKAYASGLLYATGQLHSRYQVYLKLKEKTFPNDVINQALDRLAQAGVIDDRLFAETYFDNMRTSGKLGRKGTQQKLREWGIAANIIEEASVNYQDDDELAHVAEQVPKLMQKNQRQAHRMAEQKVQQKLMQKGFSARNIQQAIKNYAETIDQDMDVDPEWENLSRDGAKAFSRYHQYTGFALTQRVKAYLARRGYDFDLISRFVDEYQKNN